jgi:Fe-S-cluster containining protein
MACLACGACCAAFRVDFDRAEMRGGEFPLGCGVPESMALPLVGRTMRMRGTDAASPRCIALEGEVGRATSCSIYDSRPGPCREFAPLAPLGIGDDACRRARRRHGLPALPESY